MVEDSNYASNSLPKVGILMTGQVKNLQNRYLIKKCFFLDSRNRHSQFSKSFGIIKNGRKLIKLWVVLLDHVDVVDAGSSITSFWEKREQRFFERFTGQTSEVVYGGYLLMIHERTPILGFWNWRRLDVEREEASSLATLNERAPRILSNRAAARLY